MNERDVYWRAIGFLRQAETIADLGTVAGGTTDAPPEPGREAEWVNEYTDRAQGALQRAIELGKSPAKTLRERAGRIAERVRRGIDNLNSVNPTNPQSWRRLSQVREQAATLERTYLIAAGAGTLLLLFGVYWYLTRNSR